MPAAPLTSPRAPTLRVCSSKSQSAAPDREGENQRPAGSGSLSPPALRNASALEHAREPQQLLARSAAARQNLQLRAGASYLVLARQNARAQSSRRGCCDGVPVVHEGKLPSRFQPRHVCTVGRVRSKIAAEDEEQSSSRAGRGSGKW